MVEEDSQFEEANLPPTESIKLAKRLIKIFQDSEDSAEALREWANLMKMTESSEFQSDLSLTESIKLAIDFIMINFQDPEDLIIEVLETWTSFLSICRELYVRDEVSREELEELFLEHFSSLRKLYNEFGIAAPEVEGSAQQAIAKEYSTGLTAGKEKVPFEPFSVGADLMIEDGRRLRIRTANLPLDQTERFFRVNVEWVDLTGALLVDLEKVDEDLANKIYSLIMAWEEQNEMSVTKDGNIK